LFGVFFRTFAELCLVFYCSSVLFIIVSIGRTTGCQVPPPFRTDLNTESVPVLNHNDVSTGKLHRPGLLL